MLTNMNLCMSTLPSFSFKEGLGLARDAGYSGVELRVHDAYHISLNRLYHCAPKIRHLVDSYGLELSIFNTYYGINDECAIDTLIRSCRRSGVKYFRVVMPVAGSAFVASQAIEGAVVPSYKDSRSLSVVFNSVQESLRKLERKLLMNGVTALVEVHWGTIMSSFSSAHYFLNQIDPRAVALTFDPANMVIEGMEDWEFGIELLHERFSNLHIKNAAWEKDGDLWKWKWEELSKGMVNWEQIYLNLDKINYSGLAAMEDFRVPHDRNSALEHLLALRSEATSQAKMIESKIAA